jgi:hypothetical protein
MWSWPLNLSPWKPIFLLFSLKIGLGDEPLKEYGVRGKAHQD